MFCVIRRHQIDPAAVDEVMRTVNEEYLPLVRETPGLIAYYGIHAGEGVIVAVTIFEDAQSAKRGNLMAANWVHEHLDSLVPEPPEIIAGEVVACVDPRR